MKVTELNREQLIQLKLAYMAQLSDYDEPGWGDLAMADDLVADDVVFREWEGTDFVEEDFTF